MITLMLHCLAGSMLHLVGCRTGMQHPSSTELRMICLWQQISFQLPTTFFCRAEYSMVMALSLSEGESLISPGAMPFIWTLKGPFKIWSEALLVYLTLLFPDLLPDPHSILFLHYTLIYSTLLYSTLYSILLHSTLYTLLYTKLNTTFFSTLISTLLNTEVYSSLHSTLHIP